MSLGLLVEQIPEQIRQDLKAAMAQLPWDIYADIGNAYLAVLTQHTGWARPGMFSQELVEQEIRREMTAEIEPPEPSREPPNTGQAPINWSHL